MEKSQKKQISFKFISDFLDRLSSKPPVGGVQITNTGLQYVFSAVKPLKAFSLKFPPGVLEDGKLIKKEEFISVAKKLYELIDTEKRKKRMQIVVSLPAPSVYTQSFSVPNIDLEKLEESAQLNLQMLSPVPKGGAYMSYQVLDETMDKYNLLGAFVEKKIVDDLKEALMIANFFPIAFEFPSLSLTRLVSHSITEVNKPSLAINISSDGIDFFIVRGGELLFDYFRSWQSIQGSETTIQKELFTSTIVNETQKVSNFVMSHYKERLEKAYLIAPALESEIQNSLKEKVGVSVQLLVAPDTVLQAPWYVALGSSMRGFSGKEKHGINLNCESASDIFFQEHSLNLLHFWGRLLILFGIFFFAAFLISYSFLDSQIALLKDQLSNSKSQANYKELTDLKVAASQFNSTVAELKSQSRKLNEWNILLSDLTTASKEHKVSIERFGATSFASPVTVSMRAANNNTAISFKNALSERKGYSGVDVPLLSIRELEDGSVGFSVSFVFDPSVF